MRTLQIRILQPMVVALGLFLPLCACRTFSNSPKPTPDERSEILIRNLLRRISVLGEEIGKRQAECVEEETLLLKGHRVTHRASDFNDSLDRMSQYLLDSEDSIDLHNRRHPESLQVESATQDLLRLWCGDCTRERNLRDSQLKEEAQAHAPAARGGGRHKSD
jgi:hypothetical protein